MNRDQLFKSKWMKATDVENDVLVELQSDRDLGVGDEREEKAVLYVVGSQKGLVLNLTNYDSIARICGSEETEPGPVTISSSRPRW